MAGRVLSEKKSDAKHFSCFGSTPGVERPIRNPDGAGWSITLLKRTDNRVEDTVGDTNDFDTGLTVDLPPRSYIEIIAEQTLRRTGYTLFGSIIIDANHTGSITIPLFKFREGEDLELPTQVARAYLHTDIPDTFYFEPSTPAPSYEQPFSNVSYPQQVPRGAAAPPSRGAAAGRGAVRPGAAGPRQAGGNHMW